MDPLGLSAALGRLVEGRKVVLLAGVLAGATPTVTRLRQMGSERILVLAGGTGTGPLPPPDTAEAVVCETTAADMVAAIRANEALFASPPTEMMEALRRYDPGGEAILLCETGPVADRGLTGRPCFGARPASWVALEDKVVIDGLWDELGIRRAPHEIVPAQLDELTAAAARLDQGLGTAWAGDAREGFNGGAVYLRWVRDPDAAREAASFFGAHCDRVRVMPFLEGVPASIHGVVFPDGTAAVRPVELVTLRRPGQSRLVYAGVASFYDPPEPVRTEMRDLAGGVGEGLRRRVGYRGGFGVDGIVTAEGFLPTELNPRLGALGAILRGTGLPLELLQAALVEGYDVGVGAREFEAVVVALADQHRSGAVASVTRVAPAGSKAEEVGVVLDELTCRKAKPGEAPTATVSFGPGHIGGFVRVQLDPQLTPRGRSVAARGVRALAFADATFGTDIGPLEPSREA